MDTKYCHWNILDNWKCCAKLTPKDMNANIPKTIAVLEMIYTEQIEINFIMDRNPSVLGVALKDSLTCIFMDSFSIH